MVIKKCLTSAIQFPYIASVDGRTKEVGDHGVRTAKADHRLMSIPELKWKREFEGQGHCYVSQVGKIVPGMGRRKHYYLEQPGQESRWLGKTLSDAKEEAAKLWIKQQRTLNVEQMLRDVMHSLNPVNPGVYELTRRAGALALFQCASDPRGISDDLRQALVECVMHGAILKQKENP